MSQPYIGEIRIFAGNFGPAGWLICDGSLLAISDNDTLFNLIGTTYGGDGQTTFAIPDLRGRIPLHFGSGSGLSPRTLAQTGGTESVTLTTNQIPLHNHALLATTNTGNQANPSNQVLAQSPQITPYIQDVPDSTMANNAVSVTGGSQPHDNFMPYICINYIISLFGIYPSQT